MPVSAAGAKKIDFDTRNCDFQREIELKMIPGQRKSGPRKVEK